MIGLIIWLVILFTWLLYETDFIRVRLLVGVYVPSMERCLALTKTLTADKPKHRVIKTLPYNPPWVRNFALSPGVVLSKEQKTWLKWAAKHPESVNPPCRIDLRINGNRYAMKVNNPNVLKEIVKVNTVKHKPKRTATISPPTPHSPVVPSGREWWQTWQDGLIPLEDALNNYMA